MFLLAKVSYLFLTTCKVVVFSRAGQSRSVEDTNALSSLLNACVTPWFCSAPLGTLLFPPRGVCAVSSQGWSKKNLTANSNHLAVPEGWVPLPWRRTLDVTLVTPWGELLVLAARHKPLGTSGAPWEPLGIADYLSMAELSTAAS